MNAPVELAQVVANATATATANNKGRTAAARSQAKEDLSNEVDQVRAMLQMFCDLSSGHTYRGTVEVGAEAFQTVTQELSERLKAVSERILAL